MTVNFKSQRNSLAEQSSQRFKMSSAKLDSLQQDFERKCKIADSESSLSMSSSENNNKEECVNKYSKTLMSDRKDDGRESASSSPASNDEGFELSSSGRSSSSSNSEPRTDSPDSQSSSSGAKVLNTHNNHFPHKHVSLTEKLRVRFLRELEQNNQDEQRQNLYDLYDVEQLRKQIIPVDQTADTFKPEHSVAFRWISRFISCKSLLEAGSDPSNERIEKELDEAHERFKEFMKFRAQFSVSHAVADQFASEFYVMSGIFPFGTDKCGVPVLYLRARIHRRWSAKLNESFQRYVAWQIDAITKSHPEATASRSIGSSGREKDGSFGICFDCLSVSYSSLDMDFLRYLVKLLVHSYPTYCRYALCVDLPWIFRSVWKLVRGWLPEDAQNGVQLITSKQLTEFIDEDQIPNSIKFNDLKPSEKPKENKHRPPKGYSSIRSIKELSEELSLSQSEVKQFTSHIDKIKKEYEQLGAI